MAPSSFSNLIGGKCSSPCLGLTSPSSLSERCTHNRKNAPCASPFYSSKLPHLKPHQGGVRIAPESRQMADVSVGPIRANNGHFPLFNHLLGNQQQITRDFQIEGSGCFEIDDRL